jgi:hypothetical protein
MIRRLHTLIAWIQGLFAPKQRRGGQSRLMGMYLDGANRPTGAGNKGATGPERQNGKFSQKRKRAD